MDNMKRPSYDEQMRIIASVLESEIKKMESMSKPKAKAEARKGLISVGVLNKSGKLAEPYVALRK